MGFLSGFSKVGFVDNYCLNGFLYLMAGFYVDSSQRSILSQFLICNCSMLFKNPIIKAYSEENAIKNVQSAKSRKSETSFSL